MNPAGRMSAERIASAMRWDPQFRPPRRPRLADGLFILTLPDGVLIEGAAERQYLRGAASASMLPQLLAVLDGERDLAALAEAISEPAAKVGKAIALLYACGLLEEGVGGDLSAGTDREIAAFLSRHIDTTRANANTAGALRRTETAVVTVTGPPAAAGALVAELRRAGLGTVEHVDALPADRSAAVTLAVGLESGSDPQALARLDRDCAAASVPWVRVAELHDAIEIGPRFERSVSLCYTCFTALHWPDQPVVPGSGDPTALDLLLAYAAADVVWLVARTCTALSPGGVTRIALADLGHERRAYPARPGCEACGTGDSSPMPGVPVAYAYDRSVAFPPRHLLNVKDHQHHYRESNLALQSDAKDYPSAARIDLPSPEAEARVGGVFDRGLPEPAGRPGRLDLPTLAALLARAAGVRGEGQGFAVLPGKLPRWAPSGGNLGSVGIYVLVRELSGVAAGLWFYAPRARQLLRLASKRDPAEVARLLHRAASASLHTQTSVALVLTGALLRVTRKYGTFAYRTVNLDAGCALGQLHATAAGLGLRLESASSWDDDVLLDALGIGDLEPITALVGVRSANNGGLRSVGGVTAGSTRLAEAGEPAHLGLLAGQADATGPAPVQGLLEGHDFEPTRIYRELLRRSRLTAEPAVRYSLVGAAPRAWRCAGPAMTLEQAGGGHTIETVLRRRRSVRTYDPRPLDGAHLACALRAAWHAPVDYQCRAAIEICVLSCRVDGLDQGLWSLEAADPIKLVRRNHLPAAEAEDIVLQREYAYAPALVLVLGSLRTMDERAGTHGYRLLLRAGTAIAHAAWLAALSVGVDGSIFAGLLPDAVDRLCGGGPYDRAQLIGLGLGYAPTETT